MRKELTNSSIDRQNILNNSLAIQEIQEQIWMKWFYFEWKIWFTKKQVIDFFEVDRKTIDRYLEINQDELRKNWYEIFTGERLKEAKNTFKRDLNVPLYEEDFGLNNAKSNLWMFDFRSFLNPFNWEWKSSRIKTNNTWYYYWYNTQKNLMRNKIYK